MSHDESRPVNPSGSSRREGQQGRADFRASGRADEPARGDAPAHADGRLPTIPHADRSPAGAARAVARERAAAYERESELAEFLPDAYLVTDAQGVIHGTNPAAADLLGEPRRSLRDRPLARFLAPAYRAAFHSRLERLTGGGGGGGGGEGGDATGRLDGWRVEVRTPAGVSVGVDLRARVVRDHQGGVAFVRWLLHRGVGGAASSGAAGAIDQAPATATGEVAENAGSRSQVVADASALLARSFDLDDTLTGMARLVLPLLGDHCWVDIIDYEGGVSRLHVTSGEARADDRPPEMSTPLSVSDSGNLVTRVLDSASPLIEATLSAEGLRELAADEGQLGALGALHASSVLSVPMIARGRVLGALTFISTESQRAHQSSDLSLAEDLAQRAALAADNARLYFMAQRANQAKDDFMASMSHELRTPLTAIIGYTELLSDEIVGPLNPTQREQLARIRASGNLLLALVDQILDLARADAGKHEPRLANVSAAAVVDQVVTRMAVQVRQKNLALTVKAPPPDVELVTDPLWLRQILVNLLSNSVKFTERGEVGVAAARLGERVAFEVWDTGIGIPPEHLERVFDPFWQVEQRMTRRYGGAGVGLSVARRLCTLLGGDISVTSTIGQGSRFVVNLPAKLHD